MNRPCSCDRLLDCRLCWLYHNDPRYTKLWNDGPRSGSSSLLSPEETESLFGEDDPTLLGNRIAALTAALGIPPCCGCEKRKTWLNRAHQWIRRASVSPQANPDPLETA